MILPFLEAKAVPADSGSPVELPPLKILVVDDEPLILEALRQALHLEGRRVDTFDDPNKGLENFSTARDSGDAYDLVITDVGMPGMDGRQLARRIKALSPSTPVVLLTGWGILVSQKEEPAVDAGLSKPPNLNLLKSTIARVLRCPPGGREPSSP